MGLFNIFKRKKRKQPEDYFKIEINDEWITVEHPKRKKEVVRWNDIESIKMITTDDGPFLPDLWLALLSSDGGCLIPQGAKGYNEVYEIVSEYSGFDFEKIIIAMGITQNAEFTVWKKN